MTLRPVINYSNGLHVKQLDAIRGWAIFLVLLLHFYADQVRILGIGRMGVDLFFVLSGFLITGILLDTKDKPGYFRNFYVKRILRIFPVYFFVLALILYVIPVIFINAVPSIQYYLQHQAWFWLYAQNWLFSIDGYPTDWVLMHTWSLCIEEQFYMFFPLLVYKFNTKNIIRILIFFIIGANVLRLIHIEGINSNYKYVNTFARLDTISVGALIAVLIRTNREILEKYTSYVMIFALVALAVMIGYNKGGSFQDFYSSFTFFALFFGAVVVWSMSANIPRIFKPAVNSKLMIFLGKYSYGIYLYHAAIHFMFTKTLLDHFQAVNTPAVLLVKTGILLFSIGISVLSFHLLELPFLRLKKKFVI